MATPYSEIYNVFLAQIQDYDMLDECVDVMEADLHTYLMRAVKKCQNMLLNVSNIDISRDKRDDDAMEFKEDLPDEVVDLLVTGMEYYWAVPKVQNTEHFHNILNTSDFKFHSNANQFSAMQEFRNKAESRWRTAIRSYAQRFYDIAGLTKIHEQKSN